MHLWCLNLQCRTAGGSSGRAQTTDRRAGRDTEDRVADQRWVNEGGSFSRNLDQAEEIEMTDVRRTGPPRRLEDPTRFGVPIEGEVDGIWQRAFHVHLALKSWAKQQPADG
jgi:hypothetical protein